MPKCSISHSADLLASMFSYLLQYYMVDTIRTRHVVASGRGVSFGAIAGPPQLMMAFSADGQADPLMIAKRDKLYGTNSDERKAQRAENMDFSYEPSKAADHWLQGKGAYQLQTSKTGFKSSMHLLMCRTSAKCLVCPTHPAIVSSIAVTT